MGYSIRVNQCAYIGAREVQQDTCAVTEPSVYRKRGVMAVLSDGIGGMRDGEKYSQIAAEAMKQSFENSEVELGLCQRLLLAYTEARTAARQVCGDPDDPEGGATVAAVAIQDGECAFLSVGDSRIYLMRGGELILLNREQTLGVSLDEYAALGYISPQDAQGNTRRPSLTNHLCEPRDKPPDLSAAPFQLAHGDRLTLMSDGVFSTLDEKEIRQAMLGPAPAVSSTLIHLIQEKNLPKQDNSSVIAISVTDKKRKTSNGGRTT